MFKFAVTVGKTDKGELRVIAQPTDKPEELISQLRQITLDNGVVNEGKTVVQYTDAAIVHSSKGRLKTRKFAPAPKVAKPAG